LLCLEYILRFDQAGVLRHMRPIGLDFVASRTSFVLVAALTAIVLIVACATPPIVGSMARGHSVSSGP
jgi:hypothetical protein